MGEVWRAVDTRLRRAVAVKTLRAHSGADPSLVTRFRREAEIAARLQHPGITVVFDFGEHEGHLFLVMELLEGEDLRSVLSREPQGLPIPRVLELARQIAEALSAAHAGGIVHRDIKPANLMVLKSGRVKICDFGIARFAEATAGLTGRGIIGTPSYMAPEQLEGGRIRVPVLGGPPVTLRLPAATPTGRIFRVRGRGAPRRDGTKGDLLVTMEVHVPQDPASNAAALREELILHANTPE